jgi:DtxR family Mn-dependent transcriptional regulator
VKTSAPSSSIEDYVKVIYSFTEWQDKPITSSQLAQRLGVANSSVSEMVRKLKDQGLVDHKPYSAITLTDQGVRLALSMVRRHRLIETYLVQQLGYRWDEVHDEAELLEHAVSDTFIERVAAKLGDPQRDPHGDPIPTADGKVLMPRAHLMGELDQGHTGRITRISDENPDLLRYLSAEEIDLDAEVEVWAASRSAGPWWCGSGTRAGPGTTTWPMRLPLRCGCTAIIPTRAACSETAE